MIAHYNNGEQSFTYFDKKRRDLYDYEGKNIA